MAFVLGIFDNNEHFAFGDSGLAETCILAHFCIENQRLPDMHEQNTLTSRKRHTRLPHFARLS